MSRYSHTVVCPADLDSIRSRLKELVEQRQFSVVYDSADYWVAREAPGQVSLSQLVTIEIFFESAEGNSTQLTCLVKNEELPLQTINHCQQIYESFRQELDDMQQDPVAVGEGHRLD